MTTRTATPTDMVETFQRALEHAREQRSERVRQLADGYRLDWSAAREIAEAEVRIARYVMVTEAAERGLDPRLVVESEVRNLREVLLSGRWDGKSTDPYSNALDDAQRSQGRLVLANYEAWLDMLAPDAD